MDRLGHTSKIANNGKIALDVLSNEDFDAVLMDIEMPEMDGIEATEAIRKNHGKCSEIQKFLSLHLLLMHLRNMKKSAIKSEWITT